MCILLGHSQNDTYWRVYFDDFVAKDTIYCEVTEKGIYSDRYIFFDEDEYHFKQKICDMKIPSNGTIWKYQIDSSLSYLDTMGLFLKLNCYATNIENIIIHTSDYSSGKDEIIQKTSTDGYQYVIFTKLNKNIREILINIKQREESKESKFIIGDLLLLAGHDTTYFIEHPLLNQALEFGDPYPHIVYSKSPSNNRLTDIHHFPNHIHGHPLIKSIHENAISEKEVLCRLFEATIENYLFYEERSIQKEKILNDFQNRKAILDTLDIYQCAHQLNAIASKLNDGHFKLKIPHRDAENSIPSMKKVTPLRILPLNKRFYIAGIFQKGWEDFLGAEVIAIDSIGLQRLSDPEFNYHTSMLSNYLTKMANSSTYLHIIHQGKDTIIQINYEDRISIPSNYRPEHNEIKYLKEHICYLRLNSFMPGDYANFIRNFSLFKESKGIIIDLRGNGGGNSAIGEYIFASFIKAPAVYYTGTDYYGNMSSIVVKPRREYHLSQKVVILIDENTACASEAFADAMRTYTNAIILGKCCTKGAYAALTQIEFPSGIEFYTNVLSEKYTISSGKNIEAEGIKPDVFIPIMHVEDMYPHKDKCLRVAIEILKEQPNFN